MSGAILKATNSSFQKDMTCYPSIYVKKVMKLHAFIFELPSYRLSQCKGAWELLHFPLVLMNRLNKTKSAVFLLCLFSLFLQD